MQNPTSQAGEACADIVQQLNALQHAEHRARVRSLLPLIDQLVRGGVSHAAIVATLSNAGMCMTTGALRKALYRWRKRQAHAPVHPSADAPASPLVPQPGVPASVARASGFPGGITSKGDLVRLRKSQTIDLNELAEIGRQ